MAEWSKANPTRDERTDDDASDGRRPCPRLGLHGCRRSTAATFNGVGHWASTGRVATSPRLTVLPRITRAVAREAPRIRETQSPARLHRTRNGKGRRRALWSVRVDCNLCPRSRKGKLREDGPRPHKVERVVVSFAGIAAAAKRESGRWLLDQFQTLDEGNLRHFAAPRRGAGGPSRKDFMAASWRASG